jgi:hypothetical protein
MTTPGDDTGQRHWVTTPGDDTSQRHRATMTMSGANDNAGQRRRRQSTISTPRDDNAARRRQRHRPARMRVATPTIPGGDTDHIERWNDAWQQ